jgi:hypothetical protein
MVLGAAFAREFLIYRKNCVRRPVYLSSLRGGLARITISKAQQMRTAQ